MPSYEQALELAEKWVELYLGGEAAIMPEKTMLRRSGWVFFYQSKAYIETGELGRGIAGGAPILVTKRRLNIVTVPSRPTRPFEKCLVALERRLKLPSGPGRRP